MFCISHSYMGDIGILQIKPARDQPGFTFRSPAKKVNILIGEGGSFERFENFFPGLRKYCQTIRYEKKKKETGSHISEFAVKPNGKRGSVCPDPVLRSFIRLDNIFLSQ